MLDSKTTAETLSALAHPSRMDIFKCLLAHHPKGLKAGLLSDKTGIAPSTLTHHLHEMEKGGVIERSANGQSTITSLDFKNLTIIATALMQLCCSADQIPENEPNQ